KGDFLNMIYHEEDDTIMAFMESYIFRKSQIWHYGEIEGKNNRFLFTYYDKELIEDANLYGGTWLVTKLRPNTSNPANYEDYYDDGTIIYDKVFKLSDRAVNAMVIDRNSGLWPECTIYFVYDDVLIITYGLTVDYFEKIFHYLAFHEVSLLSGKPLRETPGRYGTPYITRECRLAEGVELHTYEDELAFYEQYGIVIEDAAEEN
ncbi:MAG: hypothetical protein FWE82_02705, partial [Defluviitaleaceae bacterium]|nr:hypothetical protein [Defluviitaleaceae bacterium]